MVEEMSEKIKCKYLLKDGCCTVACLLTTGETKCNPYALYCKMKNKNFVNDAVQGNLKQYDIGYGDLE